MRSMGKPHRSGSNRLLFLSSFERIYHILLECDIVKLGSVMVEIYLLVSGLRHLVSTNGLCQSLQKLK